MNKRNTTLLGILVGVVLFFGVNIFANASLRSLRLDLTEERLYTLADGSKSVAAGIDEPVHLYFYFSEDVADQIPSFKTHGLLVREILEEFVLASDGKLVLEVIEPEPFSEQEDRAQAEGIRGAPTQTGEMLYFGLVGTNSTDDRELIEFFDPRRERFLEYEVARLIHALANPERKVVGFLSGLPIEGMPGNPMMGPGQPGWKILDYVGSLFETRVLDTEIEEVPEDVDVLVLIHPRDLGDGTLYAIDQYVLGGGELVAFVDPHCENDQSGQDPTNPLASMGASKASDLERLFTAWGFELVNHKVVGERTKGYVQQAQDGNRIVQRTNIVYPHLSGDDFDGEDPITSFLEDMIFGIPGILRPLPEATTEFLPLIQTTEDSMEVDVGSVQFMPDPTRLLSQFVPGNQRLTIAARVRGEVATAFPDGDPTPAAPDEDAAEPEAVEDAAATEADGTEAVDGTDAAAEEPQAEGGDEAQEAGAAEPAAEGGHLARSQGPIQVVVCADADMLSDPFWIREERLGPYSLGWSRVTDNGDFLMNAVENLAGGEDLISIRARGKSARPFERVEEMRREAEQRFLAQKQALESELRETQDRINELQREKSPDTALILSPEQEAELQRFREKELETKKKLRDVQHELLKDIEGLGTRVKWVNIALIPLLVASAAVALGAYRVKRRTSA